MGVERVASFINHSKTAQSVLKAVNSNTSVFSAAMAFGLSTIIRPAIIGCFNFKDKKDKKYSQASAVAAGLIELVSTIAIFIPLNKSIGKASKTLYNCTGSFYEGNNIALRQFKSVTNRGAKLLALVPISLARFALIKPVVDILFKDKAKVPEKAVNKEPVYKIVGGKLQRWA